MISNWLEIATVKQNSTNVRWYIISSYIFSFSGDFVIFNKKTPPKNDPQVLVALAIAILHPGLTWQTPTVKRTVPKWRNVGSVQRWAEPTVATEPTVTTGPGGGAPFFCWAVGLGRFQVFRFGPFVGFLASWYNGNWLFLFSCFGIPFSARSFQMTFEYIWHLGRFHDAYICVLFHVFLMLLLLLLLMTLVPPPPPISTTVGRRKAGSLGIGLVAGGLGGALGLGGGFLVVPALNSLKLGVFSVFCFGGFCFVWREELPVNRTPSRWWIAVVWVWEFV